MQPEAITKVFKALEALGYFPRVSISAAQFADPSLREQWIREKGDQVLNFHSDSHRETPVKLFITEPFDFEEEYRTALLQESSPGVAVRILRLDSVLRMKAEAGRGKDLADIDELNLLHERKSSYDK